MSQECLLALGDTRKLERGRPPLASGRQSALSVGGRRSQLTVVRRELPLLKHRFSQLLLVHVGFSSRLESLASPPPPFPKSAPKKRNRKYRHISAKSFAIMMHHNESRNHVLECPQSEGTARPEDVFPIDRYPAQAERGSSGRGLEERPGARRGTRFRHFREREERDWRERD